MECLVLLADATDAAHSGTLFCPRARRADRRFGALTPCRGRAASTAPTALQITHFRVLGGGRSTSRDRRFCIRLQWHSARLRTQP
jgi:hypothetical protein